MRGLSQGQSHQLEVISFEADEAGGLRRAVPSRVPGRVPGQADRKGRGDKNSKVVL